VLKRKVVPIREEPKRKVVSIRSDSEYDLGIPIPPQIRRGRPRTYRVDDLPVGASKATPKEPGVRYSGIVQAAIRHKSKHPKWDYTSRTVVENGQVMMRVWRTK
jgi:hypothetical protein